MDNRRYYVRSLHFDDATYRKGIGWLGARRLAPIAAAHNLENVL